MALRVPMDFLLASRWSELVELSSDDVAASLVYVFSNVSDNLSLGIIVIKSRQKARLLKEKIILVYELKIIGTD